MKDDVNDLDYLGEDDGKARGRDRKKGTDEPELEKHRLSSTSTIWEEKERPLIS